MLKKMNLLLIILTLVNLNIELVNAQSWLEKKVKDFSSQTTEKVLEGLANTTKVYGVNYLPQQNAITFSILSNKKDISKISLGFHHSKNRKLLYEVSARKLPLMNNKTMVYSSRADAPFMRDIFRKEIIDARGDKSIETREVFIANVKNVQSGKYLLAVTGISEDSGVQYETFSIPKRMPIINLTLLKPPKATVGSNFDVRFKVSNSATVSAKNLKLSFYFLNDQKYLSISPNFTVQNTKQGSLDAYLITLPIIEAKSEQEITMKFKAIAATVREMNTSIYLENKNDILIHPDIYTNGGGIVINAGKIKVKKASTIKADPVMLLNEKRWDYCRRLGGDHSVVKSCAKKQARKDFACLKKQTKHEQLACINSMYP